MAITLPIQFENDLASRDTNLFPIIIIGNYPPGNYPDDFAWIANFKAWLDNALHISTNTFSHSQVLTGGIGYDSNTRPILLNIPSLKESIDIEKRNYKISSINIDISNIPYGYVYPDTNKKRFSDLIAESATFSQSLINVECRIFWWSPSTRWLFPYDIMPGHVDDDPDTNFTAMQVYSGTIRKYTHDDEKVRLLVEDRSQTTLHRDLPNTNLGTDDINVPEKGKNKYVPMVYGHVDRSPLVPHRSISETVSTDEGDETQYLEYRLKAETEDVDFKTEPVSIGAITHTISALYFFDNDAYHNVHRTANDIGVAEAGPENFRYGNTDIILDVDTLPGTADAALENDFMEGKLRLHAVREFTHSEWFTDYTQSEVASEAPNLLGHISTGLLGRAVGYIEVQATNQGNDVTVGATWGGFRCYLEPLSIPNNLAVDSAGVTEKPTTNLFIEVGQHWTAHTYQYIGNDPLHTGIAPNTAPNFPGGSAIPKTHWGVWNGSALVHWESNGPHNDSGSLNSSTAEWYNSIGGSDFNTSHTTTSRDNLIRDISWWDTLTSYDHINIGIPRHGYFPTTAVPDTTAHIHWAVDTNFHTAFIVQTYRVMGIADKDYYGNVTGRLYAAGTAIPSPSSSQIIADIMEKELGVAGIIEDTAYDWGYDFTVDEKINSKKLLEGLAASSPFIPRFDNMGNFKFNVIKEKYEYSDFSAGFTPYIEIKAEDVITSSLSRTSINDVYTRVELKYKWDYGREKFSKSVVYQIESKSDDWSDDSMNVNVDLFFWNIPNVGEIGTPYEHGYYGLKTDESESTLVIDDDRGKYIRDETTAQNFAKWMLRFHANQHLKMKIRMPLRWMFVEIGDILRFDEIIDVKPYGIDYSHGAQFYEGTGGFPFYGDLVNGQQVFPDFMCISTNKTLEYCEIECIQMHNLSDNPRITAQIVGCTNPDAWNYNENAEIDSGTCLVPPVGGAGASGQFNSAFLQFGSGACNTMLHPDNESYNHNYPDSTDPIFNEDAFNYGDDILPEIASPSGTPNRYRYSDVNHIEAARQFFMAGYDEVVGLSTNMPKLYSPANCFVEDITETKIQTFQLLHIGAPNGRRNDSYPSQPPVSVALNFIETTIMGQTVSYEPNYIQHSSGAYNEFYYIPFPLWYDSGGQTPWNSVMNEELEAAWVNAGMPPGQGNELAFGDLTLMLGNLQVTNQASVTYPMTYMKIEVEPTAFLYTGVGFTEGVTTYGTLQKTITSNAIEFYEVPDQNVGHSLVIGGLDIKHQAPHNAPTEDMVESIWTIYLKITIENQWTQESGVPESVVFVRVRFGATADGMPFDNTVAGWTNPIN